MYKIAICDDDKCYRKTVIEVIENSNIVNNEQVVFYEYASGDELIKSGKVAQDLVFIDIRMPGIDGNKTAELLREINDKAVLVFCSYYFEPTIDSINIGQPFRYIMKDFNDRTLKREIKSILLEMIKKSKQYFLIVPTTGKLLHIFLDDVLYISVAKRGSSIYIRKGDYIDNVHSKKTVKELYEKLKNKGFEYAHNSYIINLKNVVKVEKAVVYLKTGVQLNISRSKKLKFTEKLIGFWQEEYEL